MKNTIFNTSIITANFDDYEIEENKNLFFQVIDDIKSHIIIEKIYKNLYNKENPKTKYEILYDRWIH